MKTKMRMTALFLAASLLLPSCGLTRPTAATMHLRQTEGTVGVSDGDGKDVEPRDNLGLYSGYGVDTQSKSYAWVDLDEVKLTKLDENSEIEIAKDGKNLEIEVLSGSLFFNVTEPLDNDETMTIRSSSMTVGIRGTCGWVSVEDPDHMTLYLLEGTVECTAGENTAIVTAGEKAEMSADGEIVVSAFYQEHIPAFVAEENLEEDILNKIPSVYPLTVLSRQTAYGQDGLSGIVDYFYDEEGYTLRIEDKSSWEEGGGEYVWTYSYDGEGHCWRSDDNGETYEMPCVPGNFMIHAGWGSTIFSAPLVTGYSDERSEIGSDGRLIFGSSRYADIGFPEGCYAIYTMDTNNYPVYIETYAPDGTLTGTCTLEWTVIG